jgi:hypothetical protein
VVFKAYQAMTIVGLQVSLANSGSGGSAATVFQLHKLSVNSLPTFQPSGTGAITASLFAAGNNIINASTVSANVSVAAGETLVVAISAAPANAGNGALVSLLTA